MRDPQPTPIQRIAGWDVDATGHTISRDGQRRHLEPRAMAVLLRLADDAPAAVTRRTLMTDVWGDTFISDDAVSAAIIRIRRAFGDDAREPKVVATVPKSGYRLIAPVEHGQAVQDAAVAAPPLTTRGGTDGTRIATVMRCSVDLAADESVLQPDEWLVVIRDLTDRATVVVEQHGGWLREESSGLVAVFGAPVAHEHHAEQALRSALVVSRLGDDETHRARVRIRTGVASGPVITAAAADGPSSVYGETVRTAGSLAAAAEPGAVLVSVPATVLRDTAVDSDPVTHPVLGAGHDVRRLVAVRHDVGVWETRQRLGLTPMHGRHTELEQLLASLRRAGTGHGQVVTLVGEPGVGKSRLLFELLERAAAEGVDTHVGQTSPLDQHSPYAAWASLLLTSADALERALADPTVDRPALDAILSPDHLDSSWLDSDPELRQTRTTEAVLAALLDDGRPTVIAVEDIHWSDQATRSLIEAVARRIARRSCLLVTTRRPEGPDQSYPLSYASSIWLEPLTDPEAAAMLDDLVGSHRSVAAWKRRVLDGAGGTPLFLEESVRTAEASGALVSSGSGHRLGRGGDTDAVPPSVHSLIAARIDRLPHDERSILLAASLLGRQASLPLVRSLVPMTDHEWSRAADALHAGELLYVTTSGGRWSLVFKHALTQEVAYRSIARDQRQELHRRAAAALEESGDATAEVLAWHLEQAAEPARAVQVWCLAAQAAARAGAFEDALVQLERAGTLLDLLPGGEERDRWALTIELARGTALVQTLGPTDPAVERAYDRARELCGIVGTLPEQFQAVWGAWFVQLMRGDLAQERLFGRQISDLGRELGTDDALSLEAHHVQWSGLTLAGDLIEAMDHSQIGIETYDRDRHHWLTYSYGGHDPGVCARNLNALAHWLAADVVTARARAAAALELADELDHAYSSLEATQAPLAMALLDRDSDTLEHHGRRLVDLVDAGRLPEVTRGYAAGFLGAALAFEGRVGEGAAQMREAAPVWTEFWGAWCFPLDTVFAEVLAQAGDVEAARAHVDRTLAWANESGGTWWNTELVRTQAALMAEYDSGATDLTHQLEAAVERALAQGAMLLALRVAATARELARTRSDVALTTKRLEEVVRRVPGQPDFRDLQLARTLLVGERRSR